MNLNRLSSVVGSIAGSMRGVQPSVIAAMAADPYGSGSCMVERWVDLDDLSNLTPDVGEEEAVCRWDTVVMIMANGFKIHRPREWFGQALNKAGYSEVRLDRLLRTKGRPLHPLARRCIGFLVSRQEKANLTDLCRIVLYQGPEGQDLRDRIRFGYFEGELR